MLIWHGSPQEEPVPAQLKALRKTRRQLAGAVVWMVNADAKMAHDTLDTTARQIQKRYSLLGRIFRCGCGKSIRHLSRKRNYCCRAPDLSLRLVIVETITVTLSLTLKVTWYSVEYSSLLAQPDLVLKESLVAQRQLNVMPGQSVSLDMPMEKQTQFVAVVGLFRQPDRERGTWKRVLRREELDSDSPHTIKVRDNTLNLYLLK